MEITGGIWDMGTNTTLYGNAYFTRFRRIDGIKINGAKFINGSVLDACYAIDMGDVTDFVIDDISLNCARDGVHIEGPAAGGRISNIRGYTGDDFIALCAGNYPGYQDCQGPIKDVMVDGIIFKVVDGLSFGVLSGIGGAGLKVQLNNVDLKNISNYPFRTNDSTAVLRIEAGLVTQVADHGVSLIAGSVASVNGRNYHVDASILTPTLWDVVYNTNAGVGAGVGPNKWNGSAWVAA